MGFFKFRSNETVISFEEPKTRYFSFMECGDLVYYRQPGTNTTITATIENFTTDDNGTPEVVEIRTAAGELIETSIANIRY